MCPLPRMYGWRMYCIYLVNKTLSACWYWKKCHCPKSIYTHFPLYPLLQPTLKFPVLGLFHTTDSGNFHFHLRFCFRILMRKCMSWIGKPINLNGVCDCHFEEAQGPNFCPEPGMILYLQFPAMLERFVTWQLWQIRATFGVTFKMNDTQDTSCILPWFQIAHMWTGP